MDDNLYKDGLAYFRHAPDDTKQCELVLMIDGELTIFRIHRNKVVGYIKDLINFV